jgi:hypothetical protein
MTKEQAKEYLSAIRAHATDEADPTFQEALELALKDSELASWLAQQREFDQILVEKFASIPPPEGLKETILESLDGKIGPIRSWRVGWLALAATVVLAALLLSQKIDLFRGSSQPFRSFRSDALAMVSAKPAPILDLETPNLGTTQAFIAAHDAPRLQQFPLKLQAMATAGCRVFLWRQHLASLTCFHLPSGKFLHAVVIRADALGNPDLPPKPYSENGWHVMFQKKEGMLVMWASQAPMEELKALFET